MQKQLTESDLIRNIKDPSTKGFEVLYDQYAALLYKIIWSVVKDSTLAERLLEDAFLIIIDQIDEYQDNDMRFTLWMAGIVKRLALLEISKIEIIPEMLPVISNPGIQFSF